MHKPVESAPPEFMARYQAVMRGDEKLDTVQKLKAFWLFGTEQGWPHPEMREYIAGLMVEVADKYLPDLSQEQREAVRLAYDYIESCEVIQGVNAHEYDERLYDQCWHTAMHVIEDIDIS